MLVLEPGKRYTIPQIKRHRWMAGATDSIRTVVPTVSPSLQEPNEQILRLMHSLGIDIARTREVRFFLFSNYFWIYYIEIWRWFYAFCACSHWGTTATIITPPYISYFSKDWNSIEAERRTRNSNQGTSSIRCKMEIRYYIHEYIYWTAQR